MISYKRDVLDRVSEVKMGRGSPICERVRKKTVEYFKNNILQRQSAKALQISSSTVHNIIKRFRETGEISVRKEQGRRPLLDARVLLALRGHCITHQHDSFIDMGPGILPETTVGKHNPPCHLQMPTKALSCRKKAICEHGPEAPLCPVGQGSFKMDCFKVEKCSMVYESKSDILVRNHGRRVLRAKEEGDLPACYQCSVQNPASLMVWGCISAYGMGSLHVLEGTRNDERYIKGLEQHMLPSRGCVFQLLQQHGFVVKECGAELACSPDLSPIENIWGVIKLKICQKRPQTLQQLETYIKQEWDQIPTLQKLITSMPRRLQTVLRRRGDATPG